jgi:regulator of protease activity HflC (stomatin/prohibitin superfamily)
MYTYRIVLFVLAASALGCSSADIPQAYRGRMFDRTGPAAFYSGTTGFTGPVLGPGTYFTGTYNEIHKVDCSTITVREPLTALTKDGVQFGLNIYVRFSPDCSDEGVRTLLTALPVDENNSVTVGRVYDTYVKPAVGEAIREVISPVAANDINDRREDILAQVRKRFLEMIAHRDKHIAIVYEVNLSNLDFPVDMDRANTARAIQAILRDKAVAERARVTAEIKTEEMNRDLAEKQGEVEAARIDKVGEALKHYPAFLQYDLQERMPEIYRQAGAQGNLVIAAPNPALLLPASRREGPSGVASQATPTVKPTPSASVTTTGAFAAAPAAKASAPQ